MTNAANTYLVRGMTCGHCREALLEEVGGVAGVRGVEVDLATGRLDLDADDVATAEIAAAVSEAGYELVGVASDAER